jgi:hypothetical protein
MKCPLGEWAELGVLSVVGDVTLTERGLLVIERGAATEDEMVLAFLQAEIRSSRYGDIIQRALAQLGLKTGLIENPNLTDAVENAKRRWVLGYRGYPRREGLFTRFPLDVEWRRVDLEPTDLQVIRYIKDTVTATPNWTNLSNGTRLVCEGARSVRQHSSNPLFQQIIAIAERIRDGARFPPLIAAQHDKSNLVLIEGHSRATAYVLESYGGTVEAFVGSSHSMKDWPFY